MKSIRFLTRAASTALLAFSAAAWAQMPPAPSAPQPNSPAVYGAGGLPCSEWTLRRSATPDDSFTMAQWMLGYVSAVEYYQGVSLKGQAATLLPWMDQYCLANPTIHFASASRSLIAALLLAANR